MTGYDTEQVWELMQQRGVTMTPAALEGYAQAPNQLGCYVDGEPLQERWSGVEAWLDRLGPDRPRPDHIREAAMSLDTPMWARLADELLRSDHPDDVVEATLQRIHDMNKTGDMPDLCWEAFYGVEMPSITEVVTPQLPESIQTEIDRREAYRYHHYQVRQLLSQVGLVDRVVLDLGMFHERLTLYIRRCWDVPDVRDALASGGYTLLGEWPGVGLNLGL